MLFTCLPPGSHIPGRFPGPAHARGKWFTVDIHCHIRSDKATAMVAGNEAVSRWFLETAASEQSQQINRQNGERTYLQGMSAEQRIADMDHMGIDIQAISPAPRQTYYGADPDLGRETSRAVNDFIAEICGRYPDRFVGLGTVPFQAPDLAIAELDRLHKSLAFSGIEIMTGKTPTRADPTSTSKSEHPDLGCVASKMRGDHPDGQPRYVSIPRHPYMTRPAYLGLAHASFDVANPSAPLPNSGRRSLANAGSPSAPRPRLEIVMPSWQHAR